MTSVSGSNSSTLSGPGFATGQASPFATDATPIFASGGASTRSGAELVQFMDMMGGNDLNVHMQDSEPPTPVAEKTPGATPSHLMSLDRARFLDGPQGGNTPIAQDGEKAAFGPFFTTALSQNPVAMMPFAMLPSSLNFDYKTRLQLLWKD